MKRLLPLAFMLILSFPLSAQTDNIKVMTYNIRCGFCEDSSDVNHWSKRKFLVAYIIKTHSPDLIGLQEAEMFQVKDLIEMLNEYDCYGAGREDGKEKGESATVLYRKSRFTLEEKKTLWLSESPGQVSKGWDAALNRTLTITKLEEKESSVGFYFLNTHFDHIGVKARTESSKLITDQIDSLSNEYPVILTGDFNYTSGSDGYRIITDRLSDSKLISQTESEGGNITFNGFGKSIEENYRIDFIFVNGHVEVINNSIDTRIFSGLYPSDHYPVISEIVFK